MLIIFVYPYVVLNTKSCNVWHDRLSYVNLGSFKKMANMGLIPKENIDPKTKCQICVQAKQPRKPFKSIEDFDSDLLQLIHSDVCDSNRVATRGGRRYFVTFIDDHSRYCNTS